MSHSIAIGRIVRFSLVTVVLVTFGSALVGVPTPQLGKYWNHLPNFFLFSAQHPDDAYQLSVYLSEHSELADWWSEHSDLLVGLVPDDRTETVAKNPWILNVLRVSYASNPAFLLSLPDQDRADLLVWLADHPGYQKYFLANPGLLENLVRANYNESLFESRIMFVSPPPNSNLWGVVPIRVQAYSPYPVEKTTVSYAHAGSSVVLASVTGENLTYLWNTNGLPPGDYSLQATATIGDGTDIKTSTNVFLVSEVVVNILLPTNRSTIGNDFTIQASVTSTAAIDRCNATLVGAQRSYTFTLLDQGGGKYGATVPINGIADGQYTLIVTAQDRSGIWSTSAITITVTKVPSVSITAPAQGTTLTGSFTLQAAVSSVDLISKCSGTLTRGGNSYSYELSDPYGSGVYTATISTAGIANGDYALTVLAIDSNGDQGSESIPVTVSNTISVEILSPTDGSTINGSFALQARISTTGSVAQCNSTLTATGSSYSFSLTDPDGDRVYTANVDSTTVRNGNYTLTVQAVGGGDYKASGSIQVRIVNAPSVAIAAPATGATLRGNFTVQAKVTSADTISSCKANLTSGSTTYSYSLTGPDQSGVYSASLSPAAIPDGSYTLTVSAKKADGTTGSQSIPITLSNTPSVTITTPTSGQRVYGSFTVQAQVSGVRSISTCKATFEGATYTLSKNNGNYGGSVNSLSVSDGLHSLTVTATDSLGSSGSATVTVYIDNVPDVTLSAPSSGSFQKGSFTVQAQVSSLHSVSSVTAYIDDSASGSLTSQGNGVYSKTVDSTTLSEGSHSLYVKAVNSLGLYNTTLTRTIHVDNRASTVVINAPANQSRFSGSRITVNATIADYTNWVRVYINGVPVQTSSYSNAYVNTVQYSIDTSNMIFYTNGTIVTVRYESPQGNSSSSYVVVYGSPPSSIIKPIAFVNNIIPMSRCLNLRGIFEETLEAQQDRTSQSLFPYL